MPGHLRLHNSLPYLGATLITVCAVALLFIAFASPVQAAGGTPGSEGNIVPCGNTPATMCTLCDLYVLVRRVTNYLLFAFALPVAVIALLIGGILLLTSGGSPDKIKRGHAAIYNAVLGLILAFAAWLLINTVAQTFLFKVPFTTGIKQWFDIPKCQGPIVSQGPDKGYCVFPDGATNCKNDVDCAACKGDVPEATCTQIKPPGCTTGYCVLSDGTTDCNPNSTCRTCVADHPGATCTPDRPPSCGIVGTCQVPQNGLCSVANLQRYSCLDGNTSQAAQVCFFESTGNPGAESGPDKTVDGRSFSIGLFQINLTAHIVAGINCPSAFKKESDGWHIIKKDVYTACVAAAKNPDNNIPIACTLSNGGTIWSKDWKQAAATCNLP